MNEDQRGLGPTRSEAKVSNKEPRPKQRLFSGLEPAPAAEPARAGKMNGAEEDAQQQPERLSGWSLGGGASARWGSLDLSGGGGHLPPPGSYDALISDVELKDSTDVLWMVVRFQIVGEEAAPAPEWAALATCDGSPYDDRKVKGMRLLNRLAAATMTPIGAITDPYELPGLFIGKSVGLVVAHKVRDGIPELVVREIRPR